MEEGQGKKLVKYFSRMTLTAVKIEGEEKSANVE
jgi:hypothetical protein